MCYEHKLSVTFLIKASALQGSFFIQILNDYTIILILPSVDIFNFNPTNLVTFSD